MSAKGITRAVPEDADECVRLRGLTRENAVSEARLRHMGITTASWAADIRSGALCGWVARSDGTMLGYAFGATATGEVVVLALLPAHEGYGLGRELLQRVAQDLRGHGHDQLFLGCTTDPARRSHGFYRHLGWRGTGRLDHHGDEILVLDAA
jgi:GNAT superfamily N-acetyltransferase